MDERSTTIAQLRHMNSLLHARLDKVESEAGYQLAALEQRVRQLEAAQTDHEQRLRSATEGVTQFKLFAGLASGGSSLMSLVAILRVFLGG